MTVSARRACFLGGQHARHWMHYHPIQPICSSEERYSYRPDKNCRAISHCRWQHACRGDGEYTCVQETLQVAVSSKLKETMLISCDDLHKLRVIPADFPNTVLAVNINEQLGALKRKLLTAFDRTLSDELKPSLMSCDPMSITLQPEAIPICVTTARVV